MSNQKNGDRGADEGVAAEASSTPEQDAVAQEQVVAGTPDAVVDAGEGKREVQESIETAPAPEQAQAPPAAAPPPRRGGGLLAALAFTLVLLMAVAAALVLQEAMHREQLLNQRLAAIELNADEIEASTQSVLAEARNQLGAKDQRVDQVRDRLQQEIRTGLKKIEAQTARQAGELRGFGSQLAEQRAELARFSADDRQSWLLAEAEYLLRLANQRLIMAGDVQAAQALLNSADRVLLEMDDVGLMPVRSALAAELAALRAVPSIDVEGTYMRLAALIEQADRLVIFEMPAVEAQPRQQVPDGWRDRLQQGYREALRKLSEYIVIRRRDVPMQSLMDPQWESLVRQNLRMLLEQAQVALLSGNQTLYSESLQRAKHWVSEFFESDGQAARAMDSELSQLTSVSIAVDLPDISRSLQALDAARRQARQ